LLDNDSVNTFPWKQTSATMTSFARQRISKHAFSTKEAVFSV
jgi:hypothetical protein